ncbi:hypothetical protein ACIQM4_03050 [Streptomyces sp. NPDC091272]
MIGVFPGVLPGYPVEQALLDRLYVNQFGPDHRGFLDLYRTEALPQVQEF